MRYEYRHDRRQGQCPDGGCEYSHESNLAAMPTKPDTVASMSSTRHREHWVSAAGKAGRSGPRLRSATQSRFDNFVPNGVADEFRERCESHFAHDVAAMRLGGVDAYVQCSGNVLIAVSFREQLHDFPLARRQGVRGVGVARFAAKVAVEDHLRDRRGEEIPPR